MVKAEPPAVSVASVGHLRQNAADARGTGRLHNSPSTTALIPVENIFLNPRERGLLISSILHILFLFESCLFMFTSATVHCPHVIRLLRKHRFAIKLWILYLQTSGSAKW